MAPHACLASESTSARSCVMPPGPKRKLSLPAAGFLRSFMRLARPPGARSEPASSARRAVLSWRSLARETPSRCVASNFNPTTTL
eukprot:11418887-Alexandrium_andersonii.AAC.1